MVFYFIVLYKNVYKNQLRSFQPLCVIVVVVVTIVFRRSSDVCVCVCDLNKHLQVNSCILRPLSVFKNASISNRHSPHSFLSLEVIEQNSDGRKIESRWNLLCRWKKSPPWISTFHFGGLSFFHSWTKIMGIRNMSGEISAFRWGNTEI